MHANPTPIEEEEEEEEEEDTRGPAFAQKLRQGRRERFDGAAVGINRAPHFAANAALNRACVTARSAQPSAHYGQDDVPLVGSAPRNRTMRRAFLHGDARGRSGIGAEW